jgi:hypothetical protein
MLAVSRAHVGSGSVFFSRRVHGRDSPPMLSENNQPIIFMERHSAALLHFAQSCINFGKLLEFGSLSPANLRPIFGYIFLNAFYCRTLHRPNFGHMFREILRSI